MRINIKQSAYTLSTFLYPCHMLEPHFPPFRIIYGCHTFFRVLLMSTGDTSKLFLQSKRLPWKQMVTGCTVCIGRIIGWQVRSGDSLQESPSLMTALKTWIYKQTSQKRSGPKLFQESKPCHIGKLRVFLYQYHFNFSLTQDISWKPNSTTHRKAFLKVFLNMSMFAHQGSTHRSPQHFLSSLP